MGAVCRTHRIILLVLRKRASKTESQSHTHISPYTHTLSHTLTHTHTHMINQNPVQHAIKSKTATADQLDTAFESHIAAFLAKKNGPVKDFAHIDMQEKLPQEVKKMTAVATKVYHEPYYAASSSGVGTLAARANSVDAGIAFCQKVKDADAK